MGYSITEMRQSCTNKYKKTQNTPLTSKPRNRK